ncbi:hypothetical protein [Nocardiopsis sp. NPDC055824]
MDMLSLVVEAASAAPLLDSAPHLSAAAPVPMEPSPTGYPNWDAPPAAPPGLATYGEMWIGWGYWVAGLVAFFGLVAAGVMMMIGKLGSRSAVSADGLRHGVAVIFGVCLVIMATSILTGLFAT